MTIAATERGVQATIALLQARMQCRAAEDAYERALVGMNEAGVPKTRVHQALHAALREAGVVVDAGDGLSAWSIRNVLDSGRHRTD